VKIKFRSNLKLHTTGSFHADHKTLVYNISSHCLGNTSNKPWSTSSHSMNILIQGVTCPLIFFRIFNGRMMDVVGWRMIYRRRNIPIVVIMMTLVRLLS
jgi:hypothetical protein